MTTRRSAYLRHRFPPEIISHAVWLASAPPDAGVAPPRILDGEPHDQRGDHLRLQRPTAAAGAPVVLLCDQPPILAQDGVWRDDPGHLRQDAAAKFLSTHGETTTLSISQAEPSTAELLSKT